MSSDKDNKPSLFERVTDRLNELLHDKPESREELIALLRDAQARNVIDSDALTMAEGALQVRELTARDVMVPRASMDMIHIDDALADSIAKAVKTRHSRFPVMDENRDDVLGIVLAKDFLKYFLNPDEFDLRDVLREAIFVPETKPLNILLREFRVDRNHMAVVVNEFGGVAGLITIEDVLEQIVGDIADEHDTEQDQKNIVTEAAGRTRVKGATTIDDFNAHFGSELPSEGYDTIGGLVTHAFGRVPKRNDTVPIGDFQFTIARADSRKIITLTVHRAGTRAE
jgi:magnesium and cobalt transporter